DGGRVIFYATPRGGRLGIYAGPEPAADRVLAVGEPLLGSAVTGFALNPVSINGAGQLAVRVQPADGPQAVLRADPAPCAPARVVSVTVRAEPDRQRELDPHAAAQARAFHGFGRRRAPSLARSALRTAGGGAKMLGIRWHPWRTAAPGGSGWTSGCGRRGS